MTSWQATPALGRAVIVAAAALALAVVFGDPVLVVLGAPFAISAAIGLCLLPRTEPSVSVQLDHRTLHEGQGTVSRLRVRDGAGVEHVARVSGQAPYVALHPAGGVVGRLLRDPSQSLDLELSPRRWGPRRPAIELVALTSRWAGWRWGPVDLVGSLVQTLPGRAPFDSRAEMPQPQGLVGAHRSRRVGSGSEFSGIRPFAVGDRLRRINWRVSLRTGDLHVVSTRAEEDSAVLVLLDALGDYGSSGGVDGDPSSLDLGVRAAAGLAEHFSRTGDRVGLRVVGPSGQFVGYGAGARHHRVLLGTLAEVRPGIPPDLAADRIKLRAAPGTVVVVLTPLLDEAMLLVIATLVRRGLPIMVVDTLPPDVRPAERPGVAKDVADLAWRMRRMERDDLLDSLAATGCPVVVWRGPGTVDEVLRRLARRAQLPQVGAR
ncbi:DUF58 domain-containing protein [Nocardioides bigeumensis]|uniref:DUF58 domain-containing protein n=1 Tax=Nocardioides bigeumensis TaxID=433657 RepID=A0ABP5K0E1_9ACTN